MCLVPNIGCVSRIRPRFSVVGFVLYIFCAQYCLYLQNSPTIFSSWFRVVHIVLLYVYTFLVPCCDVHYNFRIKRCSVHPYPQLFVGGLMFYLCCFIRHSGVMNDLNNRSHKLWNIGYEADLAVCVVSSLFQVQLDRCNQHNHQDQNYQ